MNALIITLGILTFIAAVAVVVLVALQDSKKGMSGVITGGNGGSYYDRNKSSSKEAKINKITIGACIAFALLVLALFFAQYEPKDETSKNETSKNETSKTEVSNTSEEEKAESEVEESASDAVSK